MRGQRFGQSLKDLAEKSRSSWRKMVDSGGFFWGSSLPPNGGLFSKGNGTPAVSGKSMLVKYYFIWPESLGTLTEIWMVV